MKPSVKKAPQTAAKPPRLRLTEIFYSLQGETSRTGLPTVFIRLTGCPLRCTWCDTTHSFTGGHYHSLEEILAQVAQYKAHYVCVTGGEPLAQKQCLTLLTQLCDAGYSVSLETSGALDVSMVDPRVSKILDLKAPGSGEESKNLWGNLQYLKDQDELKLVLADEADYHWACQAIAEHRLADRCPILFSAVQGQLSPAQLAEWILRDHLPVRMQVQLHKVVWGNEQGR